jgi:hypothetical protein
MKHVIAVIAFSIVAADGALAEPLNKDLAYYCVGQAAGGLWYNERTKKWEGASFRAERKFVLKMNFLRVIDQYESDYKITLTQQGESTSLPCKRNYSVETVSVADQYRSFSCTTIAYDYVFNLQTNRFLEIYVHGYVGGTDNNDNTPAVQGGTCTKIEQ